MAGMRVGKHFQRHPGWHHVLTAIVAVVQYGLISVFGGGVGLVGYFSYKWLPSPSSLIIGIPLVVVGSATFLTSLYELLVRVLSTRYTQIHCIICRRESTPS